MADPRGRAGSAVLAVLASTALFGTVGTARVLGPDEASGGTVAALRLLLGAAALLAAAAATGRGWRAWTVLWRRPATWCAAVGMAVFQVAFLTAVTSTGVAVGTLLAIGSAPLLTGVLVRRVDPAWAAATGLAVVGLGLLVLGPGGGGDAGGGTSAGGVGLALLAGLGYATYTAASARLGTAGPLAAPAAVFAVCALLGLPALVVGDVGWALSRHGATTVLYLALVPTALAYVLFARGLSGLPAPTVSTLGLTEPVVAALLGTVLLGERLTPSGWAGAGLVLAALLVLARDAGRRGARTRPGPGTPR